MSNHSILYDFNYQNPSLPLWLAGKVLIPLSIVWNGRTTADEETYHLAVRIFAGLAVLALVPITLLAFAFKWLNKEELEKKITQANEFVGAEDDLIEQDSPSSIGELTLDETMKTDNHAALNKDENTLVPLTKEEMSEKINLEMKKAQKLDIRLGKPVEGSWRAHGVKIGETNQTLEVFISEHSGTILPDLHPLYVQRIGTFTEKDSKIIHITCDFLQAAHGISVNLQESIITMDWFKENWSDRQKKLEEEIERESDLNKKNDLEDELWNLRDTESSKLFQTTFNQRGQYSAENALMNLRNQIQSALKTEEKERPNLIAFTNHDLYMENTNFVFGLALLGLGVGIWSKARFGNPAENPKTFETCLRRMMKVACHEFGHMRGLAHCTDFECTMGGCMNLDQIDNSPLLFCAQDAAKIGYLTQTPLREHQIRLLKFFENFNTVYQLNCDFSKEIEKLKSRIALLDQPAG